MLTIADALPDGLLRASAGELADLLPGPTLLHLAGRRPAPLFVSVLLHGNEDTGWLAVQALLRKYAEAGLPRALSLFIGNVAAARAGVRRLDEQPDYNRIWPGAADDGRPEHAMARQVVAEMRARGVFASIDVHNNTGLNPHYACVNRLDRPSLRLATLFSRTVVFFTRPLGVQSAAFAELCPAVTLECGKPGVARGVEHAVDFIESCLRLSEFPQHPIAPHDLDLFHTVATVRVPEQCTFGFGACGRDIEFPPELEHYNFREIDAGTVLARVRAAAMLEAQDEHGAEVAHRLFSRRDGLIRLARPLMPAMLTRDERVIRQDCLCYLMERLPLPTQA